MPRFTQIQFHYCELLDKSKKLSRKSRELRVIFFILSAITICVVIGQFLPHSYLSVISVDTSSHITRASSQNEVNSYHTAERKEVSLTLAKAKYQGRLTAELELNSHESL